MKTVVDILFIALISLATNLHAQDEYYGTRVNAGIETKLNDWTLAANGEIRTIYYVRLISRGSIQISADYKMAKPLTVGAGYEFMNFLDTKYKDYQLRHRGYVQVTGKAEWKRLSFTLREKIQLTTKDESDRIKPNGNIDTYAINPSLMSRTRFKTVYNINKSPFSPYFSFECNYQLNNPDGNNVDNLRFVLGTGYKLNKKHLFEVYFHVNDNVNPLEEEEQSKFALGVSYTFKLDEKSKKRIIHRP